VSFVAQSFAVETSIAGNAQRPLLVILVEKSCVIDVQEGHADTVVIHRGEKNTFVRSTRKISV
jgi:hypothetical protein